MLNTGVRIKDVKAIKDIQRTLKSDFERKSIAQELIQNSLNEHQKGNLQIYDNLILLEIDNVKKNNIEEIIHNIDNGVNYAKECYSSKEKRIQSLDKQQKHSKSHGRGFLSIFYFGWDIFTLQNNKKILIAAVKA